MLKPYEIISENATETIYEFRSVFLWIMYGILGIFAIGYFTRLHMISLVAMAMMVVYFFMVSLPYLKLSKIIKKAALEGGVRYEGSKWSFRQPLRVTIFK